MKIERIARTIALTKEEWDALKEISAADRRFQNDTLGILILAERDRRRAAASDEA